MGLPYPGGVFIDRLAAEGDPKAFSLPRPKVEGSPYDFSFSGLKTAVINLLHNARQTGTELNTADLAASFQGTVSEILTDHLMRAAEEYNCKTIVAAGGVSANSGLRRALTEACQQSGRTLYCPPLSLCGDNAAMVAAQGYYEYLAGVRGDSSLNGYPTRSVELG